MACPWGAVCASKPKAQTFSLGGICVRLKGVPRRSRRELLDAHHLASAINERAAARRLAMKRQRDFGAQCGDELRKEENAFRRHIANEGRGIVVSELRTMSDCGHMKGNARGAPLVFLRLAHHRVCPPATLLHARCSHAPDLWQGVNQTATY